MRGDDRKADVLNYSQFEVVKLAATRTCNAMGAFATDEYYRQKHTSFN